MRVLLLLAVWAILPLATAQAQTEEVTEFDLFQLWTSCVPLNLIVENLDEDAHEIGLFKESIEVTARSRLRSARLYDSDSLLFIFIGVNIVGNAFAVDFDLNKVFFDYFSETYGPAATWRRGVTGTHGYDSSYIVSAVSELADTFIDEYLRVNDEACI